MDTEGDFDPVALLEEERRKRQRAEADLEEERRRAEADLKLASGNYYSTITEVWNVTSKAYDDKNVFDRLKRQSVPHFYTRSADTTTVGPDVYDLTRNAANAEDYDVAVNSSRSSGKTEDNEAIFPTDIFQNNLLPSDHLAHLVPYSKNHATLYVDVAIWALGLDENAGWQTLQKAIHGATKASHRAKHTGVKHFVANRVRLSGQWDYFDEKPYVFIIPVMSEEEMREWHGTGYRAIVMTAGTNLIRACDVCVAIRMTKEGPVASPREIEKARSLLEHVILGMAYWLKTISPKIEANLDDDPRSKLQTLRGEFTTKAGQGVTVPLAISDQDQSQVKVRIVTFSDHSSEAGHPAPDPLLLAAKAARNWSSLHEQPLKAAAEPRVEEWEKDELYYLAEEEFLERRRNYWRPKTRDDLARGLGQPFGYQPLQEGESKK
jgi:hypothetical protein